MKLSDENIDTIMDLSERILSSLKKEGFKGKAKDEETLLDLKRRLTQNQSGIRGYKNDRRKPIQI
jgi:hypothetical protein